MNLKCLTLLIRLQDPHKLLDALVTFFNYLSTRIQSIMDMRSAGFPKAADDVCEMQRYALRVRDGHVQDPLDAVPAFGVQDHWLGVVYVVFWNRCNRRQLKKPPTC